ncbi:MAG: beta-ketoacyl synthase [Arenicella sp.]
MTRIPLIVSFGGVNAAGRSSSHHGYRRMIIESLSVEDRQDVFSGLAQMMGLVTFQDGEYQDASGRVLSLADIDAEFSELILEGTLIRHIEDTFFDPSNVPGHNDVDVSSETDIRFELAKRHLPSTLPENWRIHEVSDRRVQVVITDGFSGKVQTFRKMAVSSAGQLPTGFDPAATYNSRYHPRGLTLTVLAAADAINALGVPWDNVVAAISPDEMAVYASSLLGQMDDNGFGGVLQSRLKSKRVSSKQLALGFNSMPADFINAYISGSVGATGSMTGACASFLYNLRLGMDDIRSGRRRVVIVGCSEAPVTPEVMEGFDAMSALGRDDNIHKLDPNSTRYDGRKTSRPFGENAGFTIAESAQYVILMDDALAVELGADIHGAIADVFVNADGFKKSISSPGPGNYITMAKAVAAAKAIVGDEGIQHHSFVQAHGSSTPQNRVTESQILDKVAEAFEIENWPVSGVKSYVGHSLAPASGDQLIATLGVFKYGVLPGIKTIDKVADDVIDDRLNIVTQDETLESPLVAFLNSKGFGGNNATAAILSPLAIEPLLAARYSEQQLEAYTAKREETRLRTNDYDTSFKQGDYRVIYAFGENLVDEAQIQITAKEIMIPGYDAAIDLQFENPYA